MIAMANPTSFSNVRGAYAAGVKNNFLAAAVSHDHRDGNHHDRHVTNSSRSSCWPRRSQSSWAKNEGTMLTFYHDLLERQTDMTTNRGACLNEFPKLVVGEAAGMGHSVPPVSRSPTPSPIHSHSVPVQMHNTLRKKTLSTEIASDGVLLVDTLLFLKTLCIFIVYILLSAIRGERSPSPLSF